MGKKEIVINYKSQIISSINTYDENEEREAIIKYENNEIDKIQITSPHVPGMALIGIYVDPHRVYCK